MADLTLLLGPTFWLAQVASDPMSIALLQYGGIGILAGLAVLAVRVLFAREAKTLDLERERAARLEQELRQLNADVREQVMPALTRSTEAVGEAMRIMQSLERR